VSLKLRPPTAAQRPSSTDPSTPLPLFAVQLAARELSACGRARCSGYKKRSLSVSGAISAFVVGYVNDPRCALARAHLQEDKLWLSRRHLSAVLEATDGCVAAR
jgi:hypothetical protein